MLRLEPFHYRLTMIDCIPRLLETSRNKSQSWIVKDGGPHVASGPCPFPQFTSQSLAKAQKLFKSRAIQSAIARFAASCFAVTTAEVVSFALEAEAWVSNCRRDSTLLEITSSLGFFSLSCDVEKMGWSLLNFLCDKISQLYYQIPIAVLLFSQCSVQKSCGSKGQEWSGYLCYVLWMMASC